MAADFPDGTRGILKIPGSYTVSTAQDFPDWTDGYIDVTGALAPGQDFPDWVKVAAVPAGILPPVPSGNPLAWFDAVKISGLADGASVTVWHDSSGHGNDASLVAGGVVTYYSTTSAQLINGLPTVKFNSLGGGGVKLTTMGAQSQPFTVFTVLHYAASAGYQPGLFYISSPTNQAVPSPSGWGMSAGTQITSGSVTAGNYIVCWQENGASSQIRVNGAQVASGNAGTNGFAANALTLGAFMSDPMPEIIIYNAVLSAADISTVEKYLNGKWAVY